jgi:hypothetical protein
VPKGGKKIMKKYMEVTSLMKESQIKMKEEEEGIKYLIRIIDLVVLMI